MAHGEQFGDGAAAASQTGMSRRKVIATGAALAAAGVAVGAGGTLLVSDNLGHADASAGAAQPGEPVMVHLKDAQSGQLDLFVGTRRLSFTDRGIATQLAKAAENAAEPD